MVQFLNDNSDDDEIVKVSLHGVHVDRVHDYGLLFYGVCVCNVCLAITWIPEVCVRVCVQR